MSYKGKKVIALMPALNVERFIAKVIEGIPDFVDKIIVVDDASTDNTVKIAEKHGAIVLKHVLNKGSGSCYKDGFIKALALEADIAILLHSDGQHDPKEIPKLLEPIISGDADFVSGARVIAVYKKMPLIRLIGNKTISILWSIVAGKWLRDALTGYHAVTNDALKKLNVDSWSDRYRVETDMLLDVIMSNLKIKEVPVECIYGEEISLVNPLKDGWAYMTHGFKAICKRLRIKIGIKSELY